MEQNDNADFDAEEFRKLMAQHDKMRAASRDMQDQMRMAALQQQYAHMAYPPKKGTLNPLGQGIGVGIGRVGLAPTGIAPGGWQITTTDTDASQAYRDAYAENISLKGVVANLNAEIERLKTIISHPDRHAIQGVEDLINHVQGEDMYRAGAPFTAQTVWAALKTQGQNLMSMVLVTLRGGKRVPVNVAGIVVVENSNTHMGAAYFLPAGKMHEMQKKQVITDLVASIIEERVMEKMESKHDD